MSLSKRQIAASAAGGLFVLCAGALGYFLYDSCGVRSEAETDLAERMEEYTRYNEAAVFPSKKSIADVRSNAASYVAWQSSALDLASRGDKVLAPESAPIFKQRLQSEVRRLRGLPGGIDGRIAAPAFLFGFEQYLGEGGVLPAEADVPRLAVQLDTIARLVDMFAESGVLEVRSVQRLAAAPSRETDKAGAAAAKKKNAKKGKGDDEAEKTAVTSHAYQIAFAARPGSFVKVLNRLTADSRFVVVDGLTFSETADMIVDKLTAVAAAAEEKSSAKPASGARRRWRQLRKEEPEEGKKAADRKLDRLVVDPELDAPILVEMKVTVYDFGRGAAPAPATVSAPVPAPADGKTASEKSETKKEVK